MGGIQGRLNKQFAITIADLGAHLGLQRADAVAGARRRCCCGRARKPTGLLARFFGGSTAGSSGDARLRRACSHGLIRKAADRRSRSWSLFAAARLACSARRLPTSFVPEEDYGYFLLNVQLPPAASLERTDAVTPKIEAILRKTEGVADFNTIVGFSLLTRVTASNNGSTSSRSKPWDERRDASSTRGRSSNRLNGELRDEVPEAIGVRRSCRRRFRASAAQGGFSFWLQDRSGGTVEFLDAEPAEVPDAARKRPELAGVDIAVLAPRVPQVYADVDRDKVLKQGVALGDVYQTLQTFLGGLYVNQFNRFGRQWRVFLQAEGEDRTTPERHRPVLRAQQRRRRWCRCRRCRRTQQTFGPQYTNRFNVYRAAQITGAAAPGYSSGQAMAALEEVARADAAAEIGYDWADLSYQETTGVRRDAARSFALSLVFVFLILAALYESWSLPFSVLLSVPVAVFGAFVGLLLRGSTSTSTGRSASSC